VTTRAKGTASVSAIVRKIVEEHGGEITLCDRENDEPGAGSAPDLPPLKQKTTRQTEPGDDKERIADRA